MMGLSLRLIYQVLEEVIASSYLSLDLRKGSAGIIMLIESYIIIIGLNKDLNPKAIRILAFNLSPVLLLLSISISNRRTQFMEAKRTAA